MPLGLDALIQKLGLEKHPEGGHYREVYRSSEESLFNRKGNVRNLGSHIYYLLNQNDKSALHVVDSDEIWHHYAGSPLRIILFNPKSQSIEETIIGPALEGYDPQFTVPRQVWFGAELLDQTRFGLFGCTVCPGFHFKDFELISAQQLQEALPGKIPDNLHRILPEAPVDVFAFYGDKASEVLALQDLKKNPNLSM